MKTCWGFIVTYVNENENIGVGEGKRLCCCCCCCYGASYTEEVNFLVYGAQKIMAFRFISFHSIMGHPPHLITTLMESTIEATKSQTYSSYALASFYLFDFVTICQLFIYFCKSALVFFSTCLCSVHLMLGL